MATITLRGSARRPLGFVVLWLLIGASSRGGLAASAAIGPHRAEAVLGSLLGPAAQVGTLEADLLADAADGSLDRYTLLGAALVASGVKDAAELRWYETRVVNLVDELRGSGRASGSPRRRAQAVHEFLHARVLRGGYAIECTDLRAVLDEGWFNCVSASVLYCHMAGQFGLDARGLERPGHVMSRLVLPGQTLDIETTCPRWARAVRQAAPAGPDLSTSDAARGGEPAATAPGREVSACGLVATVYYNRGVDLLARGEFAQAVAANLRALDLDPSNRTARGNLLASLNNWAVHEGTNRRFAEAADLLGAGLTLEPGFKTFAANYAYVHRQWASVLRAAGRAAEAAQLLRRASADPRLAGQISP